MAMIRELFTQVINASDILKNDIDFRDEVEQALLRLTNYKIGSKDFESLPFLLHCSYNILDNFSKTVSF